MLLCYEHVCMHARDTRLHTSQLVCKAFRLILLQLAPVAETCSDNSKIAFATIPHIRRKFRLICEDSYLRGWKAYGKATKL
jgi:hypothetical protein